MPKRTSFSLQDQLRSICNKCRFIFNNYLINYYDRKRLGSDTLSIFDKVDTVLIVADRLWELNKDYSTMGMLLQNQARYTRYKMQEYNNYERLRELCNNERQKQALEDEFSAWVNLDTLTRNVLSNLVNVRYYSGSACAPITSSGIDDIVKAHNHLYLTDWKSLTYKSMEKEDYGVLDDSGAHLLLNVCNTIHNDLAYMLKEFDDDYIKPFVDSTYNESKISIEKLSPALDNWLSKRKEWINLIGTDYTERQLIRNSGEMLVRLSNIISSIQ